MAEHLPADEFFVGDHDAEACVRLRDPLHLLESLTHIEKMLERAEAAHVVERAALESERLPCSDGDARPRGDALREPDGFIREIDAHGVNADILCRGEERTRAATHIEESCARLGGEQIEKERIGLGGTHGRESFGGVVLVVPGLYVFGTQVWHWLEE